MTVNVSVKKTLALQGSLDALYEAAADVVRTGPYSLSVVAVAALGSGRFAWTIEPQTAFGIDFTGAYVTQHTFLPDEIRWETVEGNMLNSGSYRFERAVTGTTMIASIATELPIHLPAIVKTAADLFVQHRLLRQIIDLFKRIDAELAAAP